MSGKRLLPGGMGLGVDDLFLGFDPMYIQASVRLFMANVARPAVNRTPAGRITVNHGGSLQFEPGRFVQDAPTAAAPPDQVCVRSAQTERCSDSGRNSPVSPSSASIAPA